MSAEIRMNEELIKKIEKSLKIKLHDWQKSFLMKEAVVLDLKNVGRGTGKTLVKIIDMLFDGEEPIKITTFQEKVDISDWYSVANIKHDPKVRNYVRLSFMPMLKQIHGKLKRSKLQPRPLIEFIKDDDEEENQE